MESNSFMLKIWSIGIQYYKNRDIKCENLFLHPQTLNLVLGDFGNACLMGETNLSKVIGILAFDSRNTRYFRISY